MTAVRAKRKRENSNENENQSPHEAPNGSDEGASDIPSASSDAPDGSQAPHIGNEDHTELLLPEIRKYLTSFSDIEVKTYPHQNNESVHDSGKDANDRRENFLKSQLSQKQIEIDQEPPCKYSRKAIGNRQSLDVETSSRCTAGTIVQDSYPGVNTSKGSLRPGESSSSVAIMTPGIENRTSPGCIGTGVNESHLDSSSTKGSAKGIPEPSQSIEHAAIDACHSSDNGERQPLFDLNRAPDDGEEQPNLSSNGGETMRFFDLNVSPESDHGEMRTVVDLNVSYNHGEMRPSLDLNLPPVDNFNQSEVEETRPLPDLNQSDDGEIQPNQSEVEEPRPLLDLNQSDDGEIQPNQSEVEETRPLPDLNQSYDGEIQPNQSEVEETRPLPDLNQSDNGEIQPELFDLNQPGDGEIPVSVFDMNLPPAGEIPPLSLDQNQSNDGETQQALDLNVPHVLPDLNLPHLPLNVFEDGFQSIHQNDQFSNAEGSSTQQQSNPPIPVRRSQRSRPLTARALEAIADGYLAGSSRRRRIQRNAAISDMESSPGPSQRGNR